MDVLNNKVIMAPIPGKVVSLAVKEGQEVKNGDLLMVLEALKMESNLYCEEAGMVKDILVSEGQMVQHQDVLIVLG